MGGIMEFQVYNSDVRLFGVILADPPTYTLKSDIIYARAHEQKQLCHIHYLFEYSIYRLRAIITRGLYIFYPIFQCGL